MKVVNNAGEVIEVTKAAYEILYKDRGFKPYVKSDKTPEKEDKKETNKNTETKKITSTTKKKVENNAKKSK